MAQAGGDGFVEYKVQAKETIFSISRATGVKVSDILDINPGFTKLTKLQLGQIIKLPANSKIVDAEPLGVPENMVLSPMDPLKGVMTEATFVTEKSGKCVVALLLPFHAAEAGFSEDEGVSDIRKVPAKAEQFVQFYEGALMALDSLKRSGLHIELQVFDVGRGVDVLANEMSAINEASPNVIIGPVYEDQAKYLCDNLNNKNIPVIYPLSSKYTSLAAYGNMVALNLSDNALAQEMVEWIKGKVYDTNANLVYLDMVNTVKGLPLYLQQGIAEIPELVTYMWNDEITADSNATLLKPLLKPDVENYFVVTVDNQAELSRALPIVLLCKDEYKVSLIGMPDWQTYTLLDVENYFRLNVSLFSYCYTGIVSNETNEFTTQFIKYFGYAPTSLACKGFDVGLFAGQLAARIDNGECDSLDGYSAKGIYSTYQLKQIEGQAAFENRSLYQVNYGRNYRLYINKVNK